jgi:Protein of unknown function (DUF1569)
MKNLFDKSTLEEVINRLNQLTPQSQRQWGKMEVAQMLAHCKEAFKVPLSDKPLPRMFMGYLFGWMLKSKLHNEEPWKKGMPTAPNFLIKDERNFEEEKRQLIELVTKFNTSGPSKVGLYPHPFFGKLTSEQWGKSMYKHLDHHLMQFGV